MSHALHNRLANTLHQHLERHRVVVFYDPREEFGPFFDELAPVPGDPLPRADIRDLGVYLARYDGSFFALRAQVEPIVAADQPDPLLIYVSTPRPPVEESLLGEVEEAGKALEYSLRKEARLTLRDTLTDGQIDRLLPEGVGYADVVSVLRQQEEAATPSLLRTVFSAASGDELLAQWLTDPSRDELIREKGASDELRALVTSRLGLDEPEAEDLADLRDQTFRYILLAEFRDDLDADPPTSLALVPQPTNATHLHRIRQLAERLRQHHSEAYRAAANTVADAFSLPTASFDPSVLGRIDTFRFEGDRLLEHTAALLAEDAFGEALDLVECHGDSYWARLDPQHQAQWAACRLLGKFGLELKRVEAAVESQKGAPAAWIAAYAEGDAPWHRADGLHRQLEAHVASLRDDLVAAPALRRLRDRYARLVHRQAERFTSVLEQHGWSFEGVLAQTDLYRDLVAPAPGSVALILVDAFRYEMGAELAARLENVLDLQLKPAATVLPSVTVVGMAAILPEAARSFGITEHKGKLAAQIGDTPLASLDDRLRHLRARTPDLVDLRLEEALQWSSDALASTIEGAPLVLVRSQEIDAFGEGGFDGAARRVMGTAVGDVARAVRRLARAGVERFVVTADHGHLFATRKDADMHVEAPTGDTVKLTRRCWVGRGGTTPPGALRVPGAQLGYTADLDIIFPPGASVFKAGGDLAYHHGGPSLQEVVVPALSFRADASERHEAASAELDIVNLPDAVTNRIFLVGLRPANLFAASSEPLAVRVLLLHEGQQVGQTGMATGGTFDPERGTVTLAESEDTTVGLRLDVDDVPDVCVVVQDPKTGRVYAQSNSIPLRLSV